MASYAAVVSLKLTIERLLNSCNISIVPSSLNLIESAYNEVKCFQEAIKLFGSKTNDDGPRVNAVGGKIIEAACKLEDALEKHVVNLVLSRSAEEIRLSLISLELDELKQDICSFSQSGAELVREYTATLFDRPSPDNIDDDIISSRIDFGGKKKSKMVGFGHEFCQIKDQLLIQTLNFRIVSLVGMAGVGKTTLAMEVFGDPLIMSRFSVRTWVKVGPDRLIKDIVQSMLIQVNPGFDKTITGAEELADCLHKSFNSLKCKFLIVLDDVWDERLIYFLVNSITSGFIAFQDYTECVVLVTTRLEEVGKCTNLSCMFRLPFLNKEESWELLREKVFGEEEYACPFQLEKAGKKIAENCEGLPLTIVTVANLLSKADRTPEYWNEVAEKENPIFTDAYDQMSKVLFPSYKYLPQYLKACFLYMAVFPRKYEIPVSKLIMLWTAEGFLEPIPSKTIEVFVKECLKDLVGKSVVLARKTSDNNDLKTCRLHSVFWHLCIKEAKRNKFFHVLSSYADGASEVIKNQRRLCIHNNILFGIKNVNNSIASISNARSLLCTGPYHQYPVPICFGHIMLLRVLDAITIRFYEFPVEVLKLVQLRYLGLNYDGKLPSSVSKLWNLQSLIVRRHLTIIKLYQDESYLPVEIWDMRELKHIRITGSNLPYPCDGALLPNLLTLLDVNIHSCVNGFLKRLVNLEKIGFRIELEPESSQPLCCFDHISHLNKLQSLKCVVVSPKHMSNIVMGPPALSSFFSESLKKLSLSGFRYPWEHIKVICSLPNLEVLKLRCYAFQGPVWEIKDGGFKRLKFLLIEDTDLVQWTAARGSYFSGLKRLILKHCYKLERFPWALRYYVSEVELVDCNPLVVNYAKQMPMYNSSLHVNVHSSWDEGKLKS